MIVAVLLLASETITVVEPSLIASMEITSLFTDAFTVFSSEDLAVYPPFPSVILIEVLPFIESCAVELSNFSSFACGTWVVVVSSSFFTTCR